MNQNAQSPYVFDVDDSEDEEISAKDKYKLEDVVKYLEQENMKEKVKWGDLFNSFGARNRFEKSWLKLHVRHAHDYFNNERGLGKKIKKKKIE